MARTPIVKRLTNTRLLKEYASWMYCEGCNQTIGYLCYVTYDEFDFEYTCNCGNTGHVHIAFAHHGSPTASDEALAEIKNRLCCPHDNAPLVTVLGKNLQEYKLSVVCNQCNTLYQNTGDFRGL